MYVCMYVSGVSQFLAIQAGHILSQSQQLSRGRGRGPLAKIISLRGNPLGNRFSVVQSFIFPLPFAMKLIKINLWNQGTQCIVP
jgi:hypothetical protein